MESRIFGIAGLTVSLKGRCRPECGVKGQVRSISGRRLRPYVPSPLSRRLCATAPSAR
jgi:hypothetical protein